MKSFLLNILIISLLLVTYNCSFQDSIFIETNKYFKGKNLIISPLSLFQALSLTANGAKSNTLKEMLSLLQSEDISSLNQINFDLLEIFKDFTTIEIANALMTKFTPIEDFTAISEKYLAPTYELESVEQVNNWCSEKTHGKITKILEKLEPDVIMVLLNAIYFKGTWKTEFQKEKTEPKPFYNFFKSNEEEEVMVPTMFQKSKYNYFENDLFQLVELAYKNDDMSAIIILPSVNITINEFIEEYFSEKLLPIINLTPPPAIVELELPKFELSFETKMNDILQNMGMLEAFDTNADFSGIIEGGGMYISDVIHKTYLKVDEEGSEAAAVTAVIGTKGLPSADMDIVKEMKVNRPFLFLLKNNNFPEENNLLFIAKVEGIKN